MQTVGLFRFGPFELDARTGELRKHGTRLRLPEQSLQILLLLVERRDQIVSREDIRLRLWPNDTIVEYDHSINTAVRRLRSVLGEAAGTPRYVETIAKRGYRFIADVKLVNGPDPASAPNRISEQRYRLLEKLGEGGMGVVYRADDLNLGRQVAVKFVKTGQGRLAEAALQRFEQEARAASALRHPYICTIYGLEEIDGRPAMVMELVEGETLAARLSARGRLPVAEALTIARQIASALAEAHRAGVVHGDLKPTNIMINNRGVMLLDFGLARVEETIAGASSNGRNRRASGSISGTLHYMSPEQALGKGIGAQSDVFSFGVVLYEMLSGRRAFDGDTASSVIDAIVERPHGRLSDVPGPVAQIVSRCLSKDRNDRFPSGSELQAEVDRLDRETPPTSRRFPTAYGVAAAVFCAALVAAAAWLFLAQRRAPPLPALTPLTAYPGYELEGAVSPDGRQLAFVWDGETGSYGIYVKLLDAGSALRLTHGPGYDLHPAWSPDGRYIAFLRVTPENEAVYVVPALGGAERRVRVISTFHGAWQADPLSMIRGPGPAWSPDGKWIAIGNRAERSGPDSIYLVTPDGDQSRKLTSPPSDSLGDFLPAFSPDSRTVAFMRTENVRQVSEIFTVPVEGGESTRVTSDGKNISGVAWTSRDELIFTSNRTGSNMLWSIGTSGGKPRLLAIAGRNATSPSVSARGERIVYTDSFINTNIWRVHLHGSRAGSSAPTRLIATSRRNDSPKYSPDGTRIVFGSDRSDQYHLWVCKSDGTDAVQLTSLTGRPAGTPRWSPDGRLIAFDSLKDNHSVVHIIGSDGGKPQLFMANEWDNMMPSWSRDGRFVYFASRRGNQIRVFKKALQGGDPIQVSHVNGGEALEGPGGKIVYYTNIYENTGIWQVNADGTGEKPVPELADIHPSRYWDVTARGIYFLRGAVSPLRIAFFDFATRSISNVAEIPKGIVPGTPSLSVSSDDRFLLFTELDETGSDIMSIENFR